MTTDNIFGNDVLSGDLNTSLVPELGQEDLSLNILNRESSFIDPLSQDLSLTELEIVIDENNLDNGNNFFAHSPVANNLSFANIDPLTGRDAEEFQVNNVSASNTFFTPPTNELQLQGGFGDYDGGNDITFEVKNDDEVVVETYSLTGKGQASLYRSEEDGKAYIFFSGTDETTQGYFILSGNVIMVV